MNVKVWIALPLAVLLVAVCVSADRGHVEKVKGAPKTWGQMKALPRVRAEARGAGNFVGAPDVPADAGVLACTDCFTNSCAASCQSKCTAVPPTLCSTCLSANCNAAAIEDIQKCMSKNCP